MKLPAALEQLLAEAEAEPFIGWDFAWLKGRMTVDPPPWNYKALVVDRERQSPDLLDLGTGGGEWLAGLAHRPARTVATEGWAPNVPVAAARLRSLRVAVLHVEGARDNAEQIPDEPSGHLPFRQGEFHLVIARHEAFVAAEVERVLAPGGHFLTQQMGSGRDDFYRLLELPLPPPPHRPWNLDLAVEQVRATGLQILDCGEGEEISWFEDVGALVWYLKAIPWTIPGFALRSHRPRLAALHERIAVEGPLRVRMECFWLEAVKPMA
jgi:SAM-dependent methyltransferase